MKTIQKFSVGRLLLLLFVLSCASIALLTGTGAKYVTEFETYTGPSVVYTSNTTWTGTYKGSNSVVVTPTDTFTAPADGYYGFGLIGGQGGTYNTSYLGGLGGVACGAVWLDAGETIYVYVGSGGQLGNDYRYAYFQGGWSWSSGGQAGGLTMLTKAPYTASLTDNPTNKAALGVIAVAGGGGGASYSNTASYRAAGGAGGAVQNGPGTTNGANATNASASNGGYGGTTSGGAGNGGGSGPTGNATNGGGYWLAGGDTQGGWGGSGGAGWYGGGGGANDRAGGGGSSYCDSSTKVLPASLYTSANGPLNGYCARLTSGGGNGHHGRARIVYLGEADPDTVTTYYIN